MSALDAMRALTEPVWDRPEGERQLPKLGRGRPSREVQRERVRLSKLGYLVPGTEEKDAENHSDPRIQAPSGAGDTLPETNPDPCPTDTPRVGVSPKERIKYRQWAENMQVSIDRMEAAGAWHSVAYQTAKRDEWLRLANGG